MLRMQEQSNRLLLLRVWKKRKKGKILRYFKIFAFLFSHSFWVEVSICFDRKDKTYIRRNQ
jgi:hypothetical protein